ncbi:MAG: hypothetical protein E7035_08410 [Verrucomicrobiaceae bacterium]|nr:hypothetical protein [Verrucomicrobiaceae bacterium]
MAELLSAVRKLYTDRNDTFEQTYYKLCFNNEAIKPKPLDAKGFLSREAIRSLDDFVNWILKNPQTPKEVIGRINSFF